MAARLAWIWLAQRQGCSTFIKRKLLEDFGSAEAIYAADEAALTGFHASKKLMDCLLDKELDDARRISDECHEKGITIVTLGDASYPDRLRSIEDPPVVLYVRGLLPDLDIIPSISVVGTRTSTPYGDVTAQTIGGALARAGFVTVSGMAKGIDGMAQRGALHAGGISIAVLAGGVDICYPRENQQLMGDILLRGAVISEKPPGTEHKGEYFPSRNRIISGLSVATVIVEAESLRSGSMITARHALDQGRDVYAVPGAWNAKMSRGCLQLLERHEAAVLTSPEALVREYAGLLPERPKPAPVLRKPKPTRSARRQERTPQASMAEAPKRPDVSLTQEETTVLEAMGMTPCSAADLMERVSLSTAKVMAVMTMLEVKGVIRRENGMFIANEP